MAEAEGKHLIKMRAMSEVMFMATRSVVGWLFAWTGVAVVFGGYPG